MNNKKTIFSGIQPSGKLTLGNYIGAINNWKTFQDEYNCIYCIVDMHAVTTRQEPDSLRNQTLEILAQYIACGIDPEKSILFIQSHVSAHAELAWILNCYTMFGELSRMTQFKDKSAKNADNINAGLFTYPTLMAADILLYQTNLVPIGIDQKQHVEITRGIANRINGVYSDTFTIPEAYIADVGAKIMSLQDPTSKMSKSDTNINGFVLLTDSKDDIIKKFKRAVTDSQNIISYDNQRPGIANLMSIYSCITGLSMAKIQQDFEGKGYGDFKLCVGQVIADALDPIRSKTADLLKNKDYLESVYKQGSQKAHKIARNTLDKVYRKIGFIKSQFKEDHHGI